MKPDHTPHTSTCTFSDAYDTDDEDDELYNSEMISVNAYTGSDGGVSGDPGLLAEITHAVNGSREWGVKQV